MNKTVFEFMDYKPYLKTFIKSQPGRGYGFKSLIAEAARCHTAYVSQVLNQNSHFSLEQAEEINTLLQHTREESDFFILLVQLARAGSSKLKRRLGAFINERLERRQVLKSRVDIKTSLSELDQVRYYSAWYYAAIHILIAIPEFQTRDSIARRLRISSDKVTAVLDFLQSVGLAEKKGDRYTIGVNRIFLGNDSLMLPKHHVNWRMQTIDAINRTDLQNTPDLHLSTILSFAQKDIQVVKETIIRGVEEARKIVKHSNPEEDIHCLCVDFFKL